MRALRFSISIGQRGFELEGLIRVTPLPAEVQARKVELTRYLRAISNKSLLDSIADMLDVARSTDTRAQRNDIILEINRRVGTKAAMELLAAIFRNATGRDF